MAATGFGSLGILGQRVSGGVMKHCLLSLLSALIGVLPSTGQAGVASIDQFGIDKNGTNYFTDNFSNGTTPSQESRYFVFGSFPNGAESGGVPRRPQSKRGHGADRRVAIHSPCCYPRGPISAGGWPRQSL